MDQQFAHKCIIKCARTATTAPAATALSQRYPTLVDELRTCHFVIRCVNGFGRGTDFMHIKCQCNVKTIDTCFICVFRFVHFDVDVDCRSTDHFDE